MGHITQQHTLRLKPPLFSHPHRREQNALRGGTVDVQRHFSRQVVEPANSLLERGHQRNDLLLGQRELLLARGRLRHELFVLLHEPHGGIAHAATDGLDEGVGAGFERVLDEFDTVLCDEGDGGNGASEETIECAVAKRGVGEGQARAGGVEVEGRDLLAKDEECFDGEQLGVDRPLLEGEEVRGARDGGENGLDGFGGEVGHDGVLAMRERGGDNVHASVQKREHVQCFLHRRVPHGVDARSDRQRKRALVVLVASLRVVL